MGPTLSGVNRPCGDAGTDRAGGTRRDGQR